MGIIKEYLLNNSDDYTEELIYLWSDQYELEQLLWEEFKREQGKIHIEEPLNQPNANHSYLPF